MKCINKNNRTNEIQCEIRFDTKQKCQRCRLLKCFQSGRHELMSRARDHLFLLYSLGMKKDHLITSEEKCSKQKHIEANRRICSRQMNREERCLSVSHK